MTEPKARSRRLIAILGLALGVPLAAVVLYGFFLGFEVEQQTGDRERLFTAADIGLDDFTPDPKREHIVRTRYIDGTYDLEYEYEDESLYVWSVFHQEHTQRDARNVYTGQMAGGSVIMAFEDGAELEERSGLFAWGDQSSTKVFVQDGVDAGYFINARHGDQVFGVIVSGVEFPGDEALQDAIGTAFDRARSAGE